MKKVSQNKILIFIISIFLSSLLYLFFFSQNLYKSDSTFVLKNLNDTSANTNNLMSMMTGMGGNSNIQDIAILEEYLKSRKLFKIIDKKFNLIKFYNSDKTDPLKKIFLDDTFSSYYELYKSNLEITHNEETGLVTLEFYHYDKNQLNEILVFLLNESEKFLNELNKKRALIEMNFISSQLKKKTMELNELERKIILYQNKYKIIDPEIVLKFKLTMLSDLIKRNIENQMELEIIKKNKGTNNNYYKNKKIEFNEISRNIKKIKHELFDKTSSIPLNEEILVFNNLKNEYEFKKEIYIKGLTKMELSKIDTLKRSKYIEIITNPYIPDIVYFPNKFKFILSLIFILSSLYAIISFLTSIIREHKV